MQTFLWFAFVWGVSIALTKGEILAAPRRWIAKMPLAGKLLGQLLDCPYCTGFWVGLGSTWIFSPARALVQDPYDWAVNGFIALGMNAFLWALCLRWLDSSDAVSSDDNDGTG